MITTATKSGYAPVNGIELYYETHGEGDPLVLLHGGLGAIEMFGEVLPALAQGRQVIGVDLQAHGRTADIDRPISLEAMADDVAALISYLGIEQSRCHGLLDGRRRGGTDRDSSSGSCAEIGSGIRFLYKDGWYSEVKAGMGRWARQAAEPMKQTPMYAAYSQIAPRVDDWPVLLDQMGEYAAEGIRLSGDVKPSKRRR